MELASYHGCLVLPLLSTFEPNNFLEGGVSIGQRVFDQQT